MKKAEVLVSNDIVGVFGDLEQLNRIYASCIPFLGGEKVVVEMIAWRHLLSSSKKFNTTSVRGIHGPAGNPDSSASLVEKGKYLVFNQLLAKLQPILETQQRLLETGKSPNYLLIHESELSGDRQKIQTIVQQTQKPHVLVENVPSLNSLERTIYTVEALKSLGVATGIMFDLVHILKEITNARETLRNLDQKTFDSAWKAALEKAALVISQFAGSGFHIPIGVNGDSLPLEIMTKKHWQDLAKLIKNLDENIWWLTLENQQNELIRVREKSIPLLAERNRRITEMLAENEVI